MTLIRAIESQTQRAWQKTTFSSLGNFSDLAHKSWNELRSFQIFPGCRLDAPVLVLPKEWLPPGSTQRESFRTLQPEQAGTPEDPRAAASRDEAIRRALLALWLPSMTETGVRSPKPTTWVASANLLLRLARWQFDNVPSADGSVFGELTVSVVLTRLFPAMGRSKRAREDILRVIYKLIDAGERRVISDWPKLYEKPTEPTGELTLEDVTRGAPELQRAESRRRTLVSAVLGRIRFRVRRPGNLDHREPCGTSRRALAETPHPPGRNGSLARPPEGHHRSGPAGSPSTTGRTSRENRSGRSTFTSIIRKARPMPGLPRTCAASTGHQSHPGDGGVAGRLLHGGSSERVVRRQGHRTADERRSLSFEDLQTRRSDRGRRP